MKKILFVANVAKEHINKFHIPTIKELNSQGWQVDVICEADDIVPFANKQYCAVWKRNPYTFRTVLGVIQLKKILKKERYDVVYCHTPVGGFVGRLAANHYRKNGAKVIYFAHGFHFYKGCSLFNWVFYIIEKCLSFITDAMFLINEEDYTNTKKRFNRKLIVKQFPGVGVNFEKLQKYDLKTSRENIRKEFNIDYEDIVLIYVAELTPNKNQKYLLDMLKKVLEKDSNIKLLLVGPDHMNGELQKISIDYGIDNNVIFTGWRNDIGALLYASDICVASSIREGFGVNIVEAMYCKLPVVATDNRGHKTIITNDENGFLVSLSDCSKMVDKVLELISNINLRRHLSNIDVSGYDAIAVANKIVREISKICGDIK